MIILLPDDFDYYEAPRPMDAFGAAHSVSSEAPADDPAELVRRVAEEVTGQSFARPRRRIGFLD